jgi:hypothetical protein
MLCFARNPGRIAQMCGLAVGLTATLYAQPSVLTWHNDNARTGQNLQETILTPANVNSATFGKLFTIGVDGKVDAQPLYVPHLTIPGQGVHNVLYIATEHDSVYAFDADSGAPLLHVSLLGANEATSDDRSCGSQVGPEIGVTATPVIDPGSGPHGTIYVVAMTKDTSNNYHHRLHALDLTTLSEQFNGPVEVAATAPGNLGTEKKNAGDTVQTFLPAQHKDRAALLFSNGVVYTAWSSHCDSPPYTSWVIGYNGTTLAQSTVLNLVPNGNDGGIWAAGSGLQADGAGNIYVPTGNGTFDTTLTGGGFPSKSNYGNAYVKMSASGGNLAVADYFTMTNTVSESGADTDLGSGGGMLLPPLMDAGGHARDLAVVAGKDMNIYVMDRANLGKFHPSSNEIFQQLTGVLAGGVYSSPAWFNNILYYGAQGNLLKGFQFANGRFGANPISQTSATFQYPGTTPSVSANGTSNGIVWATSNGTAVLHAYSASNLGNELYNSNQITSGRDHFGSGNKFMVPTIVNGKVYVGSNGGVSGQPGSVAVFGMLNPPADFSFTVTPNSIGVVPGGTAAYTITLIPGTGFTGTVTFSLTGLPVGASAILNPQMVTGSGTSSLNVTANNVAMGSHTFTVTGSSGGITHNVGATLIVTSSTAVLSIIKHSGTFILGQQNAPYFVTVSNASDAAPTSGLVTVTETVPSGFTLVAMSGAGWSCSSNTCSRSDVLGTGASYPPITVTVNVAGNATSPQVNQISVSGGGSVTANATHSTAIVPVGSHPGSHLGVFEGGIWLADMDGNGQVASSEIFGWGASSDTPLLGDWNGTNTDKAGVFRSSNGLWFLDLNGNHQLVQSDIVGFGQSGDVPVVGDWNHSGTSKIGIFRNGTWFLDLTGNHQLTQSGIISWGQAGDVPVVGDWNGDGTTKIGVFRNGLWLLDLTGNHQLTQSGIIGWGQASDIPMVGDWNGDGKTKIGVFSNGNGLWFLDLTGNHVLVQNDIVGWGQNGDTPVLGDWDNTGTSKIGVFRSGTWFLDLTGNHQLTSSSILNWGKAGDKPEPGRW